MHKTITKALCAVLVLTLLGLIHVLLNNGGVYDRIDQGPGNVANVVEHASSNKVGPIDHGSGNQIGPIGGLSGGKAETHKTHKPDEPSADFWRRVFQVFADHKFDLTPEQMEEAVSYNEASVPDGSGDWSKAHLEAMADISPEFLHQLHLQHKQVLDDLPRNLAESTYVAGTSGIVLVGGGRYSWLAHLALLSVRDTKCTLPVEVLLPTRESSVLDKDWCTQVLPKLNARCIVLPEILGPDIAESWGNKITTYQYKALAVLVLSFEHVLLLDSDNFVMQNPQQIFDSQLYREYGMITWPDYWQRTLSPSYYKQLGITVDETRRARFQQFPLLPHPDDKPLLPEELAKVPFHDLLGAIPNLSTEAGQMFVNKRSHGEALLLALYYNVYGPKQFYRLFSLGAQGEGDKDTFVAAAAVLGRPYYQVHAKIRTLGYVDSDGKFQGVGMRQIDPLEDYSRLIDNIIMPLTLKPRPQKEQIEFVEAVNKEVFDERSPLGTFSLHCNFPKLDPLLLRDGNLYDGENKRLKYRMYSDLTLLEMKLHNNDPSPVYIDFELHTWKRISQLVCGDDSVHFEYFDATDPQWLCEFATNQVNWLTASKPGKDNSIVRVH